MESHKRTILKTITWRIIAVIVTTLGIYLFNFSLESSIKIGVVINIIKTFFYYFHERIWLLIHWQYHKNYESHLRTIAKTFSWKFITFIVMFSIIYIYTKDLKTSLISGFSINFIKTIFYYFHERAWNLTHFGRKIK